MDPRDREIAKLKRRAEKLESELDEATKVIEIQRELSALLGQLATDRAPDERGETR